MKKYLFTIIIIITILTATMQVHAVAIGGAEVLRNQANSRGGGRGGMGGGFGGMRGGGNMDIEAVNAAIAVIEEQVAALKSTMEGAEPMTFGRGGGAAGGEQVDFQQLMEEMQERQAAVQKAANSISEQLIVLDSDPMQEKINELQAVVNQANEEEAEETATLIQAMITARQEKAAGIGITIRVARGARGGNRGGAGAQRGGFAGGRGRGAGDGSTTSDFEWVD